MPPGEACLALTTDRAFGVGACRDAPGILLTLNPRPLLPQGEGEFKPLSMRERGWGEGFQIASLTNR